MSATSQFVFTGALSIPPAVGQNAVPIPFGLSGSFAARAQFRLTLTGSGTHVVNFGSMPAAGIKGLLLMFEPTSGAAPVNLRFNGGTDDVEISPGGFAAIGSPNPVAGVTALSIVHTTDVCLDVWLLG